MVITITDRIQGGIWGLLVGDAVGVPYEFHTAAAIPPFEAIEMVPPMDFSRAHRGVPPGTWSDDGAQALCLLDSLLACGKMEVENFATRLLAWHDEGLWAVDGKVFDCGSQTGAALVAFRGGTPATKAGFVRPDGKGNGALMRVLPLALWHTGSDTELAADAHTQSLPTHGHLCNQVCCALYCLWARALLRGMLAEEGYCHAVSCLRAIYPKDSSFSHELEECVRPDEERLANGGGYVVDCLHSAREALRAGSYEQVIKSAIAFGNDTDTTAAVAGGLAGVRDGITAIPARWLTALRGREMVEPLVAALLE